MALLALFIRALRQDMRGRATYLTRGGYLLVVVLCTLVVAATTQWRGAPGLQIFENLIWINFLFIVGASLSYFASAVAEEKEENTLGLLRMTDLNALSILLGKSTSRVLVAVMLLAVGFPFMALVVTLGGVSLHQIAAAYVMLGAYLFFVANLGLLASVVCPRVSQAGFFTGLVQAMLALGPGIIANLGKFSVRLVPFESAPDSLQLATYQWWRALPTTQLSSVVHTGFADPVFGQPAMLTLAAGICCFLIAWLLFEPCCGRARSSEALPTARPLGRARRNSGRPWSRALMWKDYHFTAGGPWIRWGRVVAMLAIVGMFWFDDLRRQRFSMTSAGLTLLITAFLLWSIELLLLAGRVFRSEWRDRTLSSLALLPIPMSRIAYQKIAGCLLATWPSLVAMLIGFTMVILDFDGLNEAYWFLAAPAVIGLFLLHLTAWLSLRLKYGAIPAAVLITVLLVHILAMGVSFVIMLSAFWMGNKRPPSDDLIFFSLMALGLMAIILLHILIAPRLARLAAEEG